MAWLHGEVDRHELEQADYKVFRFAELRTALIEPARAHGSRRKTLIPPASRLLELLSEHERVAVVDVPLGSVGDLRDVYGYLVEPAYRRDLSLVIAGERALEDLDPSGYAEPRLGYAWTLDRLHHLAQRARLQSLGDGLPPLTPIEAPLYEAMREQGLAPIPQYGVGPYRLDFAFTEQALAVECDGREWHDARRDRRRDRHLGRLGWEVLHLTGSEIFRDPMACVERVLSRLESAAARITYTPLEAELADGLLDRDGPVPQGTDRSEGAIRPSFLRRLWGAFLRLLRLAPKREGGELAELEFDEPEEDELAPSAWVKELDASQRAAVEADDGVVQVIAPAGSGKTTVLVARVQELLGRGVPAHRILCTTFNKDAVKELRQRLKTEGAQGVEVRTFHGVARKVLDKHGDLREDVRAATFAQWRRFAKLAKDSVAEEGLESVWIEPREAEEGIGSLKLAHMITPDEAWRRATGPRTRTLARIYQLYERWLEEKKLLDYDDLLLHALRVLWEKPPVREYWQQKWHYVLVDEYQDIEPAQELLIQIIAAPHDSLFCVGDEDQTIYTWRRARVERVIELDKKYPGLDRHSLEFNYRCAPEIVERSRDLIEQNRIRFPKTILPWSGHPAAGEITVEASTQELAAGCAVEHLEGRKRGEIVVLARTSRLLRKVALACAARGIPFDAPENVLYASGARKTLEAYFRLLADLSQARPEDVDEVFRVPNRYLPTGGEEPVANALREGASFAEAVERLPLRGEDWRKRKLEEGAAFFDGLRLERYAVIFIRRLRGEGLLDQHFANVEQMSSSEQVELEVLDAAEREAQGQTVKAYAARLVTESETVLRFQDPENGIELRTIHGAKGREWPTVVLFGADDDQLPHARSTDGASEPTPQRDSDSFELEDEELKPAPYGIEDERRLAYVAFTRAQTRLIIVHQGTPSRFLYEAGLLQHPDRRRLLPQRPAHRR